MSMPERPDVFRTLPAMEQIMVVANAFGLLQERIGVVTRVEDDGAEQRHMLRASADV